MTQFTALPAPDFTSPLPNSAWWGVTQPGQVVGTATNGAEFLPRLQSKLASAAAAFKDIPEEQNFLTESVLPGPTGVWDQKTMVAVGKFMLTMAAVLSEDKLLELARQSGSAAPTAATERAFWDQAGANIVAAANNSTITFEGILAAIYISYLYTTPNSIHSVVLRNDSVLPVFGSRPTSSIQPPPAPVGWVMETQQAPVPGQTSVVTMPPAMYDPSTVPMFYEDDGSPKILPLLGLGAAIGAVAGAVYVYSARKSLFR